MGKIFLCNCLKTGAGGKHCKPGDNSGILQTSSLFQTLAYQIRSLRSDAHLKKKKKECPSQLQALSNTCLFLCCIGFVLSTSDWHRKSTIS